VPALQDRLDAELRPPHGDPDAIRAAAARLRLVSARALATAGVRGDAAADLSLVWSGSVADQAALELGVLSARARGVLPQVADAGSALLAYADVLDSTIARVTALRARAVAAREEHARLVAAARSSEPVASAALVARADLRLAETLAEVHRAHGRVLDDFRTAGAWCARRLSGLTDTTLVSAAGHGAYSGRGHEGLLGGLSLVEQQIRIAAVPPVESTGPAEQSWDESALDALGEGAAWAYNHTVVPAVNGAADLAQAVAEHPADLLEMAVGAGMVIVGGGGQVGGIALDASGVGVVAGVPIHVAAAGIMATGAGATVHGSRSLLEHASRNDNRLLRDIDGPYADRGAPGDPLPDFLRPDGAGATWKGRVADNGKGEVWQDPDRIGNPANHKDADSMRYMDPTDRYPDGYVRYHGATGQTLTLEGKPGDRTTSHHPMTPEYTYDIPKGWKP
jgi:hypothetical protein